MEATIDSTLVGVRVLHVVRPAAGGIRAHVSALCSEQSRRGLRVGIASPQPIPTRDGACAHHRVPIAARPHLLDIAAWRALARVAQRYDLVHAHGLRGAWIAGPVARRVGAPFVFTAHNLAPFPSPTVRLLLRWAVGKNAAVIAVSHAVARSLAPYGIDAPHVIPGGIDAEAFARDAAPDRARAALGLAPGALLVAAVGRLAPEKGFASLVAAASRIGRETGAQVAIAGDGPLRDELARLAHAGGDAARLIGYTDRPADLLAAADVVVAPSIQEGLGLAPIEAMALGKPIVATRVGGLTEVVEDGTTGLLTDAGDAESLADAVIALLRDPQRRQAMGEAGRRRATEAFSLKGMADATEALYREVLAR